MKHAIISLSQILGAGRMDAQYLIAQRENEFTIAKLMELTPDQFAHMRDIVPLDLAALKLVCKSRTPRPEHVSKLSRDEQAVYLALCIKAKLPLMSGWASELLLQGSEMLDHKIEIERMLGKPLPSSEVKDGPYVDRHINTLEDDR